MSRKQKSKKIPDYTVVRIRSDEHKKLKIMAAEKGMSLGELVESTLPFLEKLKHEPQTMDVDVIEAIKDLHQKKKNDE